MAKKTEPGAAGVVPVVGIGASAGGLEAISDLLRNVKAGSGLAYVVIQHLDPHHPSMLTELLQRVSAIPVIEAKSGMKVEPDHVYVIPPNALMTLNRGRLRVATGNQKSPVMAVDHFFRALSVDRRSNAIGVILSGGGSDGSAGALAIKAEGGFTFAQDESAKHPNMPGNAVATGAIDFVLAPSEIAVELREIARHPYLTSAEAEEAEDGRAMRRILSMLSRAHGVDFTHYKAGTIHRRIVRRMALARTRDLAHYATHLEKNEDELGQLYEDLLIRVTGFFRDPEVFDFLGERLFRPMLSSLERRSQIRVWVPGCATGEEAYSIAIILLELVSELELDVQVQIFGTDVSEAAIERARSGVYPESVETEVTPERLQRFFGKLDGQYRVSKMLRDACVFARQNLAKDTPFSRLDLVSCRNVLIYLGPELQRKAMAIFHYALKPAGYLLLGSAESVGRFPDLFRVVDGKHRLYGKVEGSVSPPLDLGSHRAEAFRPETAVAEANHAPSVVKDAERAAFARYVPAGVVIDDDFKILRFHGRTSLFLEPPEGPASFDLMRMVRGGLFSEIRNAVSTARRTGKPVRRAHVPMGAARKTLVNLDVIPFKVARGESHFLIVFEKAPQEKIAGKTKATRKGAVDQGEARRLGKELAATREYLQAIIEEHETKNEELRSASEEIQSANEELQSTNEELETAKEELQSTNEELTTLNEELEKRNQDLSELNDDLHNLLASIDIPLLILSSDFRIRRFNPTAQKLFTLIPSDIGRLVTDLKTRLQIDGLTDLVTEVIESLTPMEVEVKDREGREVTMKIRPYRTMQNKIDGAVVSIIDFKALAKARKERRADEK
ncbi:MAG TPA: chemotaxis protein CheB [Thermoanaerobaculia bacterium]|nr:chemotaxis protein CheB [Thermoanaerobaculia bacterium]